MDKNKSDKSGDNRYFWSEMSVNDCGKCDKCEPKCKKGKKCDKPYKYDNCDIIKYICRLLEEQKESLKNTEKILKLLTNSKYGLKEIKEEVSDIEEAVLSPTFGLEEIKTEIAVIEEAILSPTYGLAEIKSEVAAIEEVLLGATFNVGAIAAAVLSPTYGLAEIKSEISAIEEAVLSPTFGLEEIKSEISAIEEAVLSPTFGLAEIKTEIIQILDTLANGEDFTTGAFVLNEDAGSVLVNVLNRTAEEVEVTVTQIIFDSTGAITGTTSQLLVIPPNTTTTVAFPANGSDIDLAQVEIQFQGLVDGVYGWVGARIENENDPLAPSIFVPSNIFTNQDLSPIVIAP